MQKNLIISICVSILFITARSETAVIINADDFPTSTGTITITEEGTSNDIPVNPGLGGENQTWYLDQVYNGKLSPQEILESQTTPFVQSFPDALPVSKYLGKLGDIIYSYNFNHIAGTIYLYQKLEAQALMMLGIGMISSQFTGPVVMQPAVPLFALPLEYGKTWKATSNFSIQIDTVMFTLPTKLRTDINLNITSLVDGSGTLILPSSAYECLRIKSYITMHEKLYVSGTLIRENSSRTIYYYWVAKGYGLIARIISKKDESQDNFKVAGHVSRLSSFSSGIVYHQDNSETGSSDDFRLAPNFPNPFNSCTSISFQLAVPGFVELEIFNCLGQKMHQMVAPFQQPGQFVLTWDGFDAWGNQLPSGVYLGRLIFMPENNSGKWVVAKQKLNLVR